LGHNVIGSADRSGGSFGTTVWLANDFTGTDANPLDPKLGSLANNGGLTQTMLPLAGSPAINNGSNALVPGGVTTDQRGQTRVQNGTVDIGAVEVTSSTFSTPKVTLQPVSQSFTTMLNGAVMVSFSAAASGSPYPQIQWQS